MTTALTVVAVWLGFNAALVVVWSAAVSVARCMNRKATR